jgi:hypothetical protein
MKHYLTVFLSSISFVMYGQTKTQQMIGSAGNSVSNGTAQLSWSVGEPITKTGSNGGIELAQGFHPRTLSITSMDELGSSSISIYPNPTSDLLLVDLNEKNISKGSYTLTDIHGRVIQQEKIETAKFQVSFRELPAAAYLIQISIEDKIRTYKIIKK